LELAAPAAAEREGPLKLAAPAGREGGTVAACLLPPRRAAPRREEGAAAASLLPPHPIERAVGA
jgi:hypothetical protein